MTAYSYTALNASTQEIRLVELLPGPSGSDVYLKIHLTRIPLPSDHTLHPQIVLTVEDLQKTLPEEWKVRKTVLGRFLFERQRMYSPSEPYETTWIHPTTRTEVVPDVPIATMIHPPYEAVSHVWGFDMTETNIYVTNAGLSSGLDETYYTLRVRLSIFEALQHLRQEDVSRMLWLDSVSIDQSNTEERSYQVQLMGTIFRIASRVVIWLGSESADSSLAISTLDHLGQQIELTDQGSWRVNSPGCEQPTWSRTSVPLPYDPKTWQAIFQLVHRPWFERVWTWQEAKLANLQTSVVQCGSAMTPLHTFSKGVWCASGKAYSHTHNQSRYLRAAGTTTLPFFAEPFLNVVLGMTRRNCLDARDKVYGALGLAPPEISRLIHVDYSRSAVDVYRDLCLAVLRTTRRVNFLSMDNLSNQATDGPTWIPDFSLNRKVQRTTWFSSRAHASGISEAAYDLTADVSILKLKGIMCGTVKSVGRYAPATPDHTFDLWSCIQSWTGSFCLDNTYPQTGEEGWEAFVRTLHQNIVYERYSAQDHSLPRIADAVSSVREALLDYQNSGGDSQKMRVDRGRINPTILNALATRFITTSDGLIGITSAPLAVGDIICVMLGAGTPVILRSSPSGGYSVVGLAYIHGLMDGESFLGKLDAEWNLQIDTQSGRWGGRTYKNTSSGEIVNDDPRLGPLSVDWVRLPEVRTPADPPQFRRYRQLSTGRTLNGDPRLLPEALIARGVRIQTFALA